MKQKGWFWLLFLILIVGILAILTARFNVALLLQNQRDLVEPVLGTLGFIAILAGFIILFIRLTQEMRLNQLQSEFLAAVTHELKTPIATIELSSSLLRRSDISPKERDQLWKSHETELNRLRSEVEALLEAARWDAKAVRSQLVEIDLEKWVAERCPEWREILGPGANFERIGDPLPSSVFLDPKMLSLICMNLIENAKKFAKDRPNVILRTKNNGSTWAMRFEDQGLGFDPSESKRIFKRFYRARHSAPYSIAGTGLGLYLAREACRRMRIEIEAQSPGHLQGATFTLTGKATRS